ncbi:LuxR C-terminal-related transcriptional regulator [Actinoallomurus iriomotensis]|nr:LuxR C-terminal-related transcriptional regulator [Actinoallomurus iriomotensis]
MNAEHSRRQSTVDEGRPDERDALGLRKVDRAVYGLWLRHPDWNTAAMAERLDLPAEVIAKAREVLLSKGLLAADPALPDRALPAGPDAVVERTIATIEADAARRRADALRAGAELSALVTARLTEHQEPPEAIEWIRDMPTARLRLGELVRLARHEIFALHVGDPPGWKIATAFSALNRRTLERGLPIRAIYEHGRLADRTALARMANLVDKGAEVRTATRPAIWGTVVDRTIGVIPAGNDDQGLLVITGTGIVHALSALFESCWSWAQPLAAGTAQSGHPESPGDDTGEGGGLSEHDRLLLRLLSLGIKDEAIARNMDMSVRTVRRRISQLFDRLGVTSRFQAGVQAVHRGWL